MEAQLEVNSPLHHKGTFLAKGVFHVTLGVPNVHFITADKYVFCLINGKNVVQYQSCLERLEIFRQCTAFYV